MIWGGQYKTTIVFNSRLKNIHKPMETINIFKSRIIIKFGEPPSTKQIQYLRHLCEENGIYFPFKSLKDAKDHLTKNEASRAIKELLNDNTIVFVIPYNM